MATYNNIRLELAATRAERDGVASEVISDRGGLGRTGVRGLGC